MSCVRARVTGELTTVVLDSSKMPAEASSPLHLKDGNSCMQSSLKTVVKASRDTSSNNKPCSVGCPPPGVSTYTGTAKQQTCARTHNEVKGTGRTMCTMEQVQELVSRKRKTERMGRRSMNKPAVLQVCQGRRTITNICDNHLLGDQIDVRRAHIMNRLAPRLL